MVTTFITRLLAFCNACLGKGSKMTDEKFEKAARLKHDILDLKHIIGESAPSGRYSVLTVNFRPPDHMKDKITSIRKLAEQEILKLLQGELQRLQKEYDAL